MFLKKVNPRANIIYISKKNQYLLKNRFMIQIYQLKGFGLFVVEKRLDFPSYVFVEIMQKEQFFQLKLNDDLLYQKSVTNAQFFIDAEKIQIWD